MTRLRESIAALPSLHLVALGALAFGVALWLDPWREPLIGDRAYFVYLGQAILRGEPIYANTFFGYPPLAPLLTAGAMAIGRVFGVHTYMAARFAGIAVFVGCVLLTYATTHRATSSTRAGTLAALVMVSFSLLGTLSVTGLEPKILLVFFGLAAGLAVQHARWGLAGLCCGMAGMCWQPAIVPAMAIFAVTLRGAAPNYRRAVVHYGLGMALAVLPAVAYLWATDSWQDFWYRGFTSPATGGRSGGWSGFDWIGITRTYWSAEAAFFLASSVGLGWFIVDSCRRGVRSIPVVWLSPSLAGMPLVAVGWIAWNFYNFQGPWDLIPTLAVVPFWTGWLAQLTFSRLDRWPRAGTPVAALLLAAVGVYGLGDAWLYRPPITLDEQRALIDEILTPVGPGEAIVSFEVTEVYVLEERPTPMRFLSLNMGFAKVAHWIHPQGCAGISGRLRTLQPRVVVVLDHRYQSRCVRRMGLELVVLGYTSRQYVVPWWIHTSYDPADSDPLPIRWQVYTRPATD